MKIITLLWCPVCKRMTAYEVRPPDLIQCVACQNRIPELPDITIGPLVDLMDGFLNRRPK